MQDTLSNVFSDWAGVAIPILLALIGAVILYFVLMVRAVIDMLRHDTHGVLLTFAFVALIPFPPILVMGIMVLIIWHYHRGDILAGGRQPRESPKSGDSVAGDG